MTNTLFYGDNLQVLRDHIKDEAVDLIYLDPPFNSAASYNVLFKSSAGDRSQAQIEAFEDTWHWTTDGSERAFDEVMSSTHHADAAIMLRAIRTALGENDMMAYLAMMAVRLIELHRVLKPTGSLYLHCDPTASHYLKAILDAIFGPSCFRAEICWERTNSHNMKSKGWAKSQDTLFFYSKSDEYTFNTQYVPYGPEQLARYKPDENGRMFKAENLTFSNPNPHRQFEWRGSQPPSHRSWGASLEQLEAWYAEGRILLKADGCPRLDGLKVYLDDMPGKAVGTVWTDIDRIGNTSGERLGYPTQKPVALLERIIQASSNQNDIVLDPFCGCGTTTHAAQKLGRQWLGIDITHLAISLIERRLKDAFPSLTYVVVGTPRDLAGARDLAQRDKYQFQWWATSLINAIPAGGKKKGMDRGIDAYLNFRDLDSKSAFGIVSVKGGEHVSAPMIRDLKGTVEREKAAIGVFISLVNPTREMIKEAASAGFYETGGRKFPKVQLFTIEQLLDGRKPEVPFGHVEGFRKATREKIAEQNDLF